MEDRAKGGKKGEGRGESYEREREEEFCLAKTEVWLRYCFTW